MNYHFDNYITYAATSNRELAKGVFQKVTHTYVVPYQKITQDCIMPGKSNTDTTQSDLLEV